ncbi:hypothetical protein SHKM778_80470 [Streptomyces sp. KM77-8]|uniref:Uncharacterized protein n=1 Tax=Streptomyces haneummycinicus TaxID=3074435 RepID=A0AAT9HWA8_9ACTN
MAATGGDVPFLQLVQRVRFVWPGHGSIPPGPGGRAGPTQCRPLRSPHRHMGLGWDLRRGAAAGGESSLALRSCQSEAASAPEAIGGVVRVVRVVVVLRVLVVCRGAYGAVIWRHRRRAPRRSRRGRESRSPW